MLKGCGGTAPDIGVWGLVISGSGFRIHGLGFRIHGLGFRV